VTTLDDLLSLAGADLETAAKTTGASLDQREEVTGYQGLADLDVIDAAPGIRIFLRGDDVVLIYVGEAGLPAGVDDAALQAALGSDGENLRSRQGKLAELHVVAARGVAWSEVDGEVGFVEVFPPTTLEAYQRDIYLEPPVFKQ
jgi:hypothetical protein